ncbi:MAG: 1-(5-phosphoribosyl)-5-((5-phosphoribosylamino)methylideneamino)imidazole-4-carboxamide isomerase [Ilumatobacteraceae bacterium]|nr:1-(5-phosphoribosyl)-5-((5-phosphoribosylamino)methylideneamino)imidazole-4-carboxamide isomerase [Ilumatobacteraceae bacterium]
MTVDLYPAIDLLGGRVVRLQRGDYDQQTVYGDDPVEVARRFADEGARWIHVVDLDAARSGDAINRPVVAAIAEAVRGRCAVQTGGGVRTIDDVRELAERGAARMVMGSAALREPALVARAAAIAPIAVGLDHRGGALSMHGWTETSDLQLDDAYDRYPDAAAFVVTDIERDGMLSGPDVEGLRAAADAAAAPVIASGGVATLADVEQLAGIDGLGGVITGKALYEGRFTVAAALATLAQVDR